MAQIGILEPLRNFKFRLYFADDPSPLLGFSKMSALGQATEVIKWRDGAHPYNSSMALAGGTQCEAVTCEQGLGLDDGRLEDWALAVYDWKSGEGAFNKAAYRRDIRIEILDMNGSIAETQAGRKLNYLCKNCFVSEYKPVPELDANALNVIGVGSLKFELEGFSRQQ